MKTGYYWAILYGETMIVQVIENDFYGDSGLIVKTFEYGYQGIDDVEFISKEPLKI